MTNGTREERQQTYETNFSRYKTSCYGHFSSIEFLNKYKNPILNFIYKDNNNYGKFDIFLMTNKDSLGITKEQLNRNKHLGAQFCARSINNITYYYFTQAIWQDKTGNYLSLNDEQCNLIKRNTTDSFKVVLINSGKLYVFENFSEDIVDGHKVPLECAVKSYEICKADFRKPVLGSTIKVGGLGGVRYKPMDGNQLHAKQIRVTVGSKSFIYASVEAAWSKLSFHYKDKTTGKWLQGEPKDDSVVPFPFSLVTFKRCLKKGACRIFVNETTEREATLEYVTKPSSIRKDDTNTIIGGVKSANNSDSVTSDDCKIRNNVNNRRSLDKLLNKLADKLVETVEQTVSEKEIKAYVLKCGSNQHMLQALTDALNDKGFVKEAVYAAKLFDILNTISI